MVTIQITFELPKDLVEKAQSEGILNEENLTSWLQDELERKQAAARLLDIMEKLHALEPKITQEEINAEIQAYKDEENARIWAERNNEAST